jgi:signal transduction histidine kinase
MKDKPVILVVDDQPNNIELLEAYHSRVTEGTGLGLPLSKKLVEMHGGKLSAESGGLNKGISVRFTLPIISRKVV